jgi:hypothetical protein
MRIKSHIPTLRQVPFLLKAAVNLIFAAVLLGWGIYSFGKIPSSLFAGLPYIAIFAGVASGIAGAVSFACGRRLSTLTSAEYACRVVLMLLISPLVWIMAWMALLVVVG